MVVGKTRRKKVLDLFACAGVGGDGYQQAGFHVTGVDNDPKALRWHPEPKIEADVMEVLEDHAFLDRFDLVHASPPCQLFTAGQELAKAQGKKPSKKAVDLLTPTIEALERWGGRWVAENVPRSPLAGMDGVAQMCGSAFGLKVQRHRLFLGGGGVKLHGVECQHEVFDRDPVTGKPRPWGVYYAKGDNIPSGGRTCRDVAHAMECMGVEREVPWDYLKEGLPPAYTREVGRQVKEQFGW